MLQMGAFSNHIDDQQAWKALFQSFLSRYERNSEEDFEVEVGASSISIISNLQLGLFIHTTVSNPKKARESMRYTLSEVIAISQRNEVKAITSETNIGLATAADILKKIFSEDVLSTCGLTNTNLEKFDNSESKTLRIPIRLALGFSDLAKANLKILSAAMIGVGIHGMKKALLGQGPKLEINETIQESMLELAPDFQEAFFIEEDSKGQKVAFVINYGLLLNLLIPKVPELRLQESSDSKYKLEFDKKELLAYLIDTFEEGFMLHIQGDQARPICLPKGNLAKSKILLSLILDCSSSMTEDFDQLISHVKSFLKEYVAKSAPGDIIRIVNFANESFESEYYLTGNIEEDLANIFEYLDSLNAEGVTLLYKTVQDEIAVLSTKKYQGYTESAIIFTDGENFTGEKLDVERAKKDDDEFLEGYQQTMAQLQMQNPAQVLSVFSMGLGNYYNQTMLEQWAHISGVHHTHLKTMDDFAKIKAHMEKMRSPRALLKFVQQEMKHMFSVYEGTLAIPLDFTLKANEPFSLNDRTFQFEAIQMQPALQEAANDELEPSRTFTPMRKNTTQAQEEPINQEVNTLTDKFSRLWSLFRNG